MEAIHAALCGLPRILGLPAALLGPVGGLVLVSVASGIALSIALRYTSNPASVRAARKRVQAELLAIRVYRHDLGVVLRAELRLCAALGRYASSMARPFAVMLVPFAILFAHLDAVYSHRALRPGEHVIVRAIVDPATVESWTLHGNSGVRVDSPPVRIRSRGEIAWRIRAVVEGSHSVRLVAGDRAVEKRVEVAEKPRGAAPRRAASSLAALFLAPGEPSIDRAVGVLGLDVAYPRLDLRLRGRTIHWAALFIGVSTLVVLAVRKRAGIEL